MQDPDIDQSQWDSLGITLPPVDYETGSYSTFFCPETEHESSLYELWEKRKDPKYTEMLVKLQQTLKVDPPQDEDFIPEWIEQIVTSKAETELLDMTFFAEYNQ